MELSIDTSLPPSREQSPATTARRSSLPELPEGVAEGYGDFGEGSSGDSQQQPQQEEAQDREQEQEQEQHGQGEGGPEPQELDAEAGAAADGGDSGEGAEPGPGPALAPDFADDTGAGDAASAAVTAPEAAIEEEPGSGRGPTGTGMGSEPSTEAVDATAEAAAAAAVVAATSGSRSGSPSRGGSRGIMGVRGLSKSFNVPSRESPTRQLRSRGSLAPVREATSRTPSARSSRPASSALAGSSVPPSPDLYGSEGPPGTGQGPGAAPSFSLWPGGSAISTLSGYASLSLDDVEIRGSAMKLRTNSSSVAREGGGGGGGGRMSPSLAPLPSAPPQVAAATASPPATPPPATPPSPPPAGPVAAVAAAEQELQMLPSNSSVPSMAMGNSPVKTITAGRNRPLVLPFAERHSGTAVVLSTSAAAAAAAVGVSAAAAGLGGAVGRRQGLHGNIRHGSTFQQQPLAGTSSQGSCPRDSVTSGVRRASVTKDTSRTGFTPSDTPLPGRTPAATAEGVPDDPTPAPPLYAVHSHDWDKPRAAGAAGGGGSGYAAGGGAAAVKAVTASGGSAARAAGAGAGGSSPADVQLHQQLMLGEAIQIRSIHKSAAAPGLDPPSVSASVGMGLVGVPGRRGRRLPAQPSSSASATAATMAAYFADLEAAVADGTAADKVLLPSGLARRLKAARMMASGPPPFQRRREPVPPSPSGIKLDGFMLLEAADEEMPEAVQFASLESRHISAVESADLSYFVALRSLDVSDNKLPDLICLATLQALVRLRAASCRLSTLGPWPGSIVGGDAASGAAAGGGETAMKGAAAGVLRRQRTRTASQILKEASGAAGAAVSAGTTEPGEAYDSLTVGPEDVAQGDAAPAAASVPILPGRTASASGSGGGSGRATTDGATGLSAAAAAPPAPAPPLAPDALVASLLAPLNGRPFQYLEVLDLSFNQLQPHMVLLPGTPLALLPRLAELDLSSNQLRHLPSPSEIAAAAAKVAAAAALGGGGAAGAVAAAAVAGVAFPALRRLRLANNGLKGGAIASLAALAPPCLTHLDLSHNAIAEAPRLKFLASPLGLGGEDSASSFASSNGPAGLTSQPPNSRLSNGAPNGANTASHLAAQSSQQKRLLQQQISQQELAQKSQQQRSSQPQQQSQQPQDKREAERFGSVLTRLAVLDLSFNRVASEGAVEALLNLPALQKLLLAGNPLAVTAQRPRAGGAAPSSKLDFGEPNAPPARPSVAASLTARFARIPETAPKQQANTLAAAAAAVITAAAAPERVAEAYDRLDATIEQWRLNTVMEEDEEEDEEEGDEEGAGDDRTFLTGVGIQERRRKGSAAASAASAGDADGLLLDPVTEGAAEGQEDGAPAATAPPPPAADATEERPLWESITDPTERLAVALGLDPLALPMHTGALTTDSAGAIAALRFALAHPLVEANDGLAPHPGYAAATTTAQLKRKPRRPAPTQRLAPMGSSSAAAVAAAAAAAPAAPGGGGGLKAVKIQTVEAMLDGMKGKLAALEASLAAQLAAAPTVTAAEAARRAEANRAARYAAAGRRGNETDSEDGGDDDAGSTGSGLPEDVIDQIERESESEEADDEREVEEEMGQMDPKQGIVLVVDQLVADEAADGTYSSGNGNTGSGDASQSLGRGGLSSSPPSRITVTLSTSPPQQVPPPPLLRTAGSSPRRLGTAPNVGGGGGGAVAGTAPGTGGGGSPRKGVSIAPAISPQVPATPVVLPGGAASALGYAS